MDQATHNQIVSCIWVLSNRKPLRKNLGKRNCELAPDDIQRITRVFLDFKETPESKIFPNEACGYREVVVERPLRLHSQLSLPRAGFLHFYQPPQLRTLAQISSDILALEKETDCLLSEITKRVTA